MLSRDLIEEDLPPVTYPRVFPIATVKFVCPVPGCAGTAGTKYGLRWHFRFLHPQDLGNLPVEGCYPHCDWNVVELTSQGIPGDKVMHCHA